MVPSPLVRTAVRWTVGGVLIGAGLAVVGSSTAMATPPGTLDTSTLTPAAPTGSSVKLDATQWVGAEIVVGSGTQLTGLDLAISRETTSGDHGRRHRELERDMTPDDLAVSVWSATAGGLPNNEIEATTVSRVAKGSCADGHLTEVDLFNPPAVKLGEKIFVVLGGLDATGLQPYSSSIRGRGSKELDWCAYGDSNVQTLAFSSDRGSTWRSTMTSGPQPLWRGGGGTAVLGLADYVTSGPPSVTPETPLNILLPFVAAGTIGTVLIVRRRRATLGVPHPS